MSGSDLFTLPTDLTLHLKRKILTTLSLVILGVTVLVTASNILHDKNQEAERIAKAHDNVHQTYNEIRGDIVRFYTTRANTNLYTPGVLEAFRASDHDKLYELVIARWQLLQKENPSLIVMQFHKADGTSLLRMHEPDVYGDAIALKRSMVAYIHKHHKSIAGFEEGRQGLAFRMLTPILDNGRYLGAVEFGIDASYITQKINRFTGYDAFFVLHQDALGILSRAHRYIPVGEHMVINVPKKFLPMIQEYAQTHTVFNDEVITYHNRAFAITTVPVADYRNRPIGGIMFIMPGTDILSHVLHMVLISAFVALSLFIVLGFLISRAYDTMAAKLKFQELYNQTVLDAIPSPVIVTNGHELIAANRTFLSFFRYPNVKEFKRDHACVCEFFEAGDTDEYLMPMVDDQRWTEYIMSRPNIDHKAKVTIEGQTTIFDVKLSVLRFNHQERYVVIFTDISSIQNQSVTDPLTRIANRLHFSMVYEHAINIARREEKPLGLIFFDIDHFKQVNDRFGHLAGDHVLRRIAELIKQRIRRSDIVARWGGEEFIVLLPDTPLHEAARVAETLREAVEAEAFETVGKITCSFGVAGLEENDSPKTLLKRADELLYDAKAQGRNRVAW